MMNTKLTHGKVCRKIDATATQTPVPVINGPDTPESTVTLNFYIGSVCSEEILDIPTAKQLLIKLQEILN